MSKSSLQRRIIALGSITILSTGLIGCGSGITGVLPTNQITQTYGFTAYTHNTEQREILVKFKKVHTTFINAFNQRYNTQIVKIIPELNIYVLAIPANKTVTEMVQIMSKDPLVEYVEPNQGIYVNPINSPQYHIQSVSSEK